ncbi:MAG: energy transducer TonB [Verrucomicrobiae bacterium]|nr:energy transducer TonB [Verrucomicrobiae bacterium]
MADRLYFTRISICFGVALLFHFIFLNQSWFKKESISYSVTQGVSLPQLHLFQPDVFASDKINVQPQIPQPPKTTDPVPSATITKPSLKASPTFPTTQSSQKPSQTLTKHKPATSSTQQPSGATFTAAPDSLHNSPPLYPDIARQKGQEGFVLLQVQVSEQGIPLNVQLLKSSRFPLLDQAALKSVRQWKFKPAQFNGHPIASQVNVPIQFRLSDPL